ncbi:hypothetical protein G7Z17_g1612 [Cylindrodendrum hubeiense]|uniref:Uncharacterized protein n=1 Tax=Cylindrodendrum hubeiense TaxID=595255 RepID=A0A9P5HEH3_9HYPO|nr:hypothetical protein G7Z17_g1612 [Cylindrodendrum hubeiense]
MNLPPGQRSSSVTLGRMQQQLEVIGAGDDWTGVTSTARRRRLQNRLNQRAYSEWNRPVYKSPRYETHIDCIDEGKRKLGQDEPKDDQHGRAFNQEDQISDNIAQHNSRSQEARPPLVRGCRLEIPEIRSNLGQFARQAYQDYLLASPRPSALQTLVQLNVLNALGQNAAALGITTESLCDDASLSPFNYSGPGTTWGTAPPSLQPTALQIETPHHPWIDLFPVPQMRDSFIRACGSLDEDELNADLVDVEETDEKPNLIVWGNPSDPRAWEITVPFLRKWGWLVRECQVLLDATNYWREKRGEKRLNFKMSIKP